MMKHILAAIDGSDYSLSVCDHAAWFAARSQMAVQLLHVLPKHGRTTDTFDLSGSIGFGARSGLLEELAALDEQKAKLAQQHGRAVLEDAAARLRQDGVEEISSLLRYGDLVETVQQFEQGVDLVVLGKRGAGADGASGHLGSNLERVVRAVHRPVLVASRQFKSIERILIAFDGGQSAQKAVDHVATEPALKGTDCRLLTVGEPSQSVRDSLEAAATKLRLADCTVTVDIEPGQPETTITHSVETNEIDLLIMGAYGHSRIRSLIIGSTTTQMVRSCTIPVLLFR